MDECCDDFWAFVLSPSRVGRVKNPIWKPIRGALYPRRSHLLRSVSIWEEYFLRWTSSYGESSFLMTKIYDTLSGDAYCEEEKQKDNDGVVVDDDKDDVPLASF